MRIPVWLKHQQASEMRRARVMRASCTEAITLYVWVYSNLNVVQDAL